LVDKGLTNDNDSAIKIISKRLKLKQDEERLFGLDDLNKMFCASIFKESLVDTIRSIEAISEGGSIGLQLKQSN
jgi:hypothetical protein